MNDKNNTTQLKEEELKDVQGGSMLDGMCQMPGEPIGMPNVSNVAELFGTAKPMANVEPGHKILDDMGVKENCPFSDKLVFSKQ